MSTVTFAPLPMDQQLPDIGPIGSPSTADSKPLHFGTLGATIRQASNQHTNQHRRQPSLSAMQYVGGPILVKTNLTQQNASLGTLRKIITPSLTPLPPVKPLKNPIAIPSLLQAFQPAFSAPGYPDNSQEHDLDEFTAIADSFVVPDDPVSVAVPPSNRPSILSGTTIGSVRDSDSALQKFDYSIKINIQNTRPSNAEALRWAAGMVDDEPVPEESSFPEFSFPGKNNKNSSRAMALMSTVHGSKTRRTRDIMLTNSQDVEKTGAGPLREQINAIKWDNVPWMPDQASFVKLVLGETSLARDASTAKVVPDAHLLTPVPASPRHLQSEHQNSFNCNWWDAIWSFIACSGCGGGQFP
eukprot:GEMP01031894.1.p1 GENE.GEMP01031894.1~~GEMP01031894.1.p1  ORF type:complete len:356 (+),score=65.72 GEMP01031894.1:101-1168(+)